MNEMPSPISPPQAHDESSFKTYRRHKRLAHFLNVRPRRTPGFRQQPELVYLDVAPDVEPGGKPPVRIFVGTEPAQHRAERVLIWSIMKVRDPSRVYEIHLMKDLEGFDRRHWKTGFTGYRYAIPALAGGEGRAIYNDVDQIYLRDPAELFDLEMAGAGQLSITERETSVMLLDCKKMIQIWDVNDARRMTLHKPFRIKTSAVPGLWRPLPKEWNARDFEYERGRSKLLHFTILHKQPWEPFPKQLKYEPHPLADIWHAMEHAADAGRFTIFTKARPSSRFQEALATEKTVKTGAVPLGGELSRQPIRGIALVRHRKAIHRLIHETGARSLLVWGSRQSRMHRGAGAGEAAGDACRTLFGDRELSYYDPLSGHGLGGNTYDGVVSLASMTRCPEDDVPWMLDEMFGSARRFVYVVAILGRLAAAQSGQGTHPVVQDPDWWRGQMTSAARRHGEVRWTLCVVYPTLLGTRTKAFIGVFTGGSGKA